jgi:hypothetical protein
VQKVSPAELVAVVIMRTLEEIGDLDENKISVIDFCSGSGGMMIVQFALSFSR